MKKLISILLATALVLAGCGGKENPPASAGSDGNVSSTASENNATAPEGTGSENAGGNGAGEISLAIFEGGYGPDFWNEVTKMFEADTGIKVNMQISPTIGDTIMPQIVAGDVPDFTNIQVNDASGIVATMIAERALMNLNEVFDGPQFDSSDPLRNKIVPGFLDSLACAPYADGNIFLAPESGAPMGLIYNKTLFDEKGWSIPVTWDDFFALGDKAKEEGIALFTYQGLHPGYWDGVLPSALKSALGDDFEKVLNYVPGIWTDSRTLAVLENFEKIYTGGYLLKGTPGLTHTEAQAAQMMNEALFIPCGVWMEDEMSDADRAPGYSFAMAPGPVLNAGDIRYVAAYFGQFSIPANAPNPENAKIFLRYLYTDKVVELFTRHCGGNVMVTANAMDLSMPFLAPGQVDMLRAYAQPGAAALIDGNAFAAPPEGTTIVVKDEIYNPITEVMLGNMTAHEWAENMDKAYQDMAEGR
jgi:N-acetylglucosamine transport system substrate-binding protein